MKATRAITILALLVLATASLQAGVIPGRWEKVEALHAGYPIVVTLESGERLRAVFDGLSEKGLLLTKGDKQGLDVPKAHVVKIEGQEKIENNGLGNGAIIGAVVGGGFGLGAALACACEDEAGFVAVATALYGAIGTGVGVGVDALFKSREVLYKAPKK
jgi:hypothetical protein